MRLTAQTSDQVDEEMNALPVTSLLSDMSSNEGIVQRKNTQERCSLMLSAKEPLVHQLSPLFGALFYKQINSPQGDGTVAKKQKAKHSKTNQKHNNTQR